MPRAAALLLALAGLMGAAGVALAARAAHGGEASLASAAQFLVIHAAAVAGLAGRGRRIGAAALVLALGTCLFSADLALRALAGTRLFALAAPAGGLLMILGWLGLALAGLLAAGRAAQA